MYYVVLAIFLLGFLLIFRTINSPFGQVLKAIRENEPRALSLGYEVDRYKLLAFVLSAALSGLAGATKVLVLGVFPRGEKPADPLRTKNLAVNALIKDIGDGSMISYLEINDKLINADGTQNRENMPDLVHLSPKGYQIWADAIEAKLVELLGEKK